MEGRGSMQAPVPPNKTCSRGLEGELSRMQNSLSLVIMITSLLDVYTVHTHELSSMYVCDNATDPDT